MVVDVAARNGVRPINPEFVLETIEDYYYLRSGELGGKPQVKHLVEPRQVAYMLLREMTELSLQMIGALLNRDHSTVVSGLKRGNEKLTAESLFAQRVKECRQLVEERREDA